MGWHIAMGPGSRYPNSLLRVNNRHGSDAGTLGIGGAQRTRGLAEFINRGHSPAANLEKCLPRDQPGDDSTENQE